MMSLKKAQPAANGLLSVYDRLDYQRLRGEIVALEAHRRGRRVRSAGWREGRSVLQGWHRQGRRSAQVRDTLNRSPSSPVPRAGSFGETPKATFATDSPLEEGVWSEPVSEVGLSAPGGLRVIPRPLWTIIEAEKGYFGLENGGVSVFGPWQLPPLSGS
jgi:hypothetical protein